MSIKTVLVQNISKENDELKPVIANAIDVEEDGHLWMLVNSKMKKWENRSNIPLKLDFIPEDCHLRLSGIGHITERKNMPVHLQEQAKDAKAVMKMKIYYGEYLPLTDESRKQNEISVSGDLLSRISESFMGRTNRRLLFFR